MAGFLTIYCIGGLGGYLGADGINPIDLQIWQGEGNRQWFEPHYVSQGIRRLGRIRAVIPKFPFDPNGLLDACIAFWPDLYSSCPSFRAIEQKLQDADFLDFDLDAKHIPEEWFTLRAEARPIFQTLNIFEGQLNQLDLDKHWTEQCDESCYREMNADYPEDDGQPAEQQPQRASIYRSLADLKTAEPASAWSQTVSERNSWLLVVAPHGGTIEKYTERFARQVAGNEHSLFIFEGKRSRGRELRISSHLFRDPELSKLQKVSKVTLSIHGKADAGMTVYLGGWNEVLREDIRDALERRKFQAQDGTGRIAGMDKNNFVNRTSDYGVQLELCRGLRERLVESPDMERDFVQAIREGLETFAHYRRYVRPPTPAAVHSSEWWEDVAAHFLDDCLGHINTSTDESNPVNECRQLFDALNKTWDAFHRFRKLNHDPAVEGRTSDNAEFQDLLTLGINHQQADELAQSTGVFKLVSLSPQVMNHQTLRNGDYDPNDISPQLANKARKDHRDLVNKHRSYLEDPSRPNSLNALLTKLAELLYVIRSNIAHGEKTVHSPDLAKTRRDADVCRITAPIIRRFFDVLFRSPNNRLAAYGTLRPGQPNHSMLLGLGNTWLTGTVKGTITEHNGFPLFSWHTAGQNINVEVLDSPGLPSKFDELDAFEGPAYKRIWIPVNVKPQIEVCNIYIGRE